MGSPTLFSSRTKTHKNSSVLCLSRLGTRYNNQWQPCRVAIGANALLLSEIILYIIIPLIHSCTLRIYCVLWFFLHFGGMVAWVSDQSCSGHQQHHFTASGKILSQWAIWYRLLPASRSDWVGLRRFANIPFIPTITITKYYHRSLCHTIITNDLVSPQNRNGGRKEGANQEGWE